MPKGLDARIAWRSSQQQGLITRAQLLGLGLTEQAIDYRIAVGRLHVVHPTVYRLPGVPDQWQQRVLAALLGAGDESVISHRAAGVIWGLESISTDVPDVLLPHERKVELAGVVIHRTRRLLDEDVTTRQGLRVTSVARTLVDLAGIVPLAVLERVLDDALRRQIVTLDQLRRALDSRGPNGVRGWARLNALVVERVGTKPTGSSMETVFFRGLKRRRLPPPVKQFVVNGEDGRFIGRVDFAYPDLRIAIEVDGGGHLTLAQRRKDSRRQNKLVIAGWRVLRFEKADRNGQREAFETIEAAFAAFGEPDPKSARVGLPKRQRTRSR